VERDTDTREAESTTEVAWKVDDIAAATTSATEVAWKVAATTNATVTREDVVMEERNMVAVRVAVSTRRVEKANADTTNTVMENDEDIKVTVRKDRTPNSDTSTAVEINEVRAKDATQTQTDQQRDRPSLVALLIQRRSTVAVTMTEMMNGKRRDIPTTTRRATRSTDSPNSSLLASLLVSCSLALLAA